MPRASVHNHPVKIGITTLLQGLNTLRPVLLYLQDVASVGIGSTTFDHKAFWSRVAICTAIGGGERILAAAALVVAFPFLFLASIIVVAISGRSPFVAHQRVGHEGRPIWVLKLRTMWKGDVGCRLMFIHRLSAAEAPLILPGSKSVRVTSRFAAFCRRYSVDELPQLWQVVTGEMALVGPRPLTRQELDIYYGPDAVCVLTAKPGLSGLWQISGRSRLSYGQRRRLDLFFVRNWSLGLYCKILLVTFGRVLTGKDAW